MTNIKCTRTNIGQTFQASDFPCLLKIREDPRLPQVNDDGPSMPLKIQI